VSSPFASASDARDIIRKRRVLGLTQAQLAKLVGTRRATLSRLESGKSKPNVWTVERVETALKRKQAKKK
jgi:predicted transcriptional regulator